MDFLNPKKFCLIVVFSAFTVLFLISLQNPLFPYMKNATRIVNAYIPSSKLRLFSSPKPYKIEVVQETPLEILSGKSFLEVMKPFPWKDFQRAAKLNNAIEIQNLSQSLINLITPFVVMPPIVKINTSCVPPPLDIPQCNTTKNDSRKLGILFQFGFDADILEIHLHELDDVVDKFFILESTRAHYRALQKPLIWEVLKAQPRFETFLSKIVHFVIDDAEVAAEEQRIRNSTSSSDYGMEQFQERRRWQKFLEWNEANQFFEEDDILGFGDTDEIPSRDVVNHIKKCGFSPAKSIDVGLWFPFGSIDQAFQTDWPVPGHPYTYGDPTFHTLKDAKTYKDRYRDFPTRNRGKSEAFIIGGMHMTHYGYLPFQIVKRITIIERAPKLLLDVTKLYDELEASNISVVERKYAEVPSQFKHRIIKLGEWRAKDAPEVDKVVKFPWFYNCNRDRYPSWERKSDTRLTARPDANNIIILE